VATLVLTLTALLAAPGAAEAASGVSLQVSPARGVVGSTVHVSGTCPLHAYLIVNVGIGPRHPFGSRAGILSADSYKLSKTGHFAGPMIIRRDPEVEGLGHHPRAGDELYVILTCFKRSANGPTPQLGHAYASFHVAAGGSDLPLTGSAGTRPQSGLGAGLVVAGGALLWAGRRRYLAAHRA
jgi:LPXTG-motif cell wall-anchored protein